ncbi:hypothetical protein AB0I45_01745 [Brevibacterium sp. NPDC049920]|uniref:hypothetical protein n=1 Tax=Brevibacterium sp. NPDC049920 TaxID=3155279 RepID=UPI00340EAB79
MVGIALAALGPLAFGFGLEVSRSWTFPMIGLGVIPLLQAMNGMRSVRTGSGTA